MTREPIVVEQAPNTPTLLRLLVVAFALLAALVAILSYAYLRVAWQLDAARAEQRSDSEVLAEVRQAVDEVRDVAVLFASFADPDPAVRAEVRADLQRLADEIRAEQADDDERTGESAAPTTTTTGTTSTTTPASTTTTTTTTAEPDPPAPGGVCLGPVRIGACP